MDNKGGVHSREETSHWQFNSANKSGLVKLGQVRSGQVKMHLRIEFDSDVGPTC